MFWAFKKPLNVIRYYYSYTEIKQYIKIKMSEKNIESLQYYEILAKIISAAFGGSKSKKAVRPQSETELASIIEKMK